jgi:dienelactone hydrolase
MAALGLFIASSTLPVDSAEARAKIKVNKRKAMLDKELKIKVKGLGPYQDFTLRARTQDRFGRVWSSAAQFQADDKGKANLSEVAPISGSYQAAHSMGLYWSLSPEDTPTPEFFLFEGDWPIAVELTLETAGGQILDTEVTERKLLNTKKVKRTPIEDEDFVGTLFTPKKNKLHPVVVVLGGSGGGLNENVASVLASHGVATLALAYFGITPPLPETLEELPLEYFENVFNWLSEQPKINPNKIFVLGRSKGAEAALLLGSKFPQFVKKVVGYVPSHVVWQGLGDFENPVSSWTQNAAPLSFVPFFCLPEDFIIFPISLLPCHQRALDTFPPEVITPASIVVENINGPVMLLSGGQDKLWPSSSMADAAITRLQNAGHPHAATHLLFQDAGHLFDLPFIPSGTTVFNGLDLGGSTEANGLAAANSWSQVVDFIKGN